MSSPRIAVLPGDGIGVDVTASAVAVLRAATKDGLQFEEALIGGIAIDTHQDPLPPATLELCQSSAATLLGAVGGPKWDHPDAPIKVEKSLLGLRKGLGLYANIRPVVPHPSLADASPIKNERLQGVDILFVRELTGGIYFGEKGRDANRAFDTCVYTAPEVERIIRTACELARGRSKRVTSVDKVNVLDTSRLWRSVAERIQKEEYPDIEMEHLLVDAMAMHLLSRPAAFDVVVTENMFGDILTDEASVLPGSLGLLPSASLGTGTNGLYEPVHGSAPDIAGKGIANPYAAILSAAMLLRHSLNEEADAARIEAAVASALDDGILPADIMPKGKGEPATTQQATDAVLARLK